MRNSKLDLYQVITEKIVKEMEKGVLPWKRPWVSGGSIPRNYLTKKPYRGINIWLLFCEERQNPFWLTYKQAESLGGKVRKGEKGTLVVFWKWLDYIEQIEDKIESRRIPLLRYYIVFNAEQIEGLPKDAYQNAGRIAFEPIEACERIIAGYKDCPIIKHDKQRAFYSPELDYINLPNKESFESIPAYYAVAFHEISHSTGHPTRLNRKGVGEQAPFGSPVYSREELVAELGASFLCGVAGIELYTLANSSAYLQSWLNALKSDKKLFVQAAGQAQKAVGYILGDAVYQNEPEEIPAAEYKLSA